MTKIQINVCPICESQKNEPYLTVRDHSISKEEFQLNQCQDCKFIYTQNPPTEAECGTYYESEDYISHSDTKKGIVNRLYHTVRDLMLIKKYNLVKGLGDGKKLLDVGCGTGYFLNYMKQKGFQTIGVEVSQQARDYGITNFGLDILPPDDFLQGKLDNDYDIITLWHVLEHLYDLNGYVKKLKASLGENGYLIIAVPNPTCFDAKKYQSFWAGYDVPRHLWHFTPDTMAKLCDKHGLTIQSKHRLPFDVFYNCMLSEKYQNHAFSFLRGGTIGAQYFIQSTANLNRSSSLVYVIK